MRFEVDTAGRLPPILMGCVAIDMALLASAPPSTLQLEPRLPDHLGPALPGVDDVLGELIGIHQQRVVAGAQQGSAHVAHFHHLEHRCGLKLVRLTAPSIDREYALLTRKGHAWTPAVQAFCEFVQDYAPGWAKEQSGRRSLKV